MRLYLTPTSSFHAEIGPKLSMCKVLRKHVVRFQQEIVARQGTWNLDGWNWVKQLWIKVQSSIFGTIVAPPTAPTRQYRLNEALSRDRDGQYAPTIPDYTLLAMQPFDHGAWGNYEVHGPSQHHQTLRNLRRSKTYLFGLLAKQWYHFEPECYEMVVSGDIRGISWNCLDFRSCGRLVQ